MLHNSDPAVTSGRNEVHLLGKHLCLEGPSCQIDKRNTLCDGNLKHVVKLV